MRHITLNLQQWQVVPGAGAMRKAKVPLQPVLLAPPDHARSALRAFAQLPL